MKSSVIDPKQLAVRPLNLDSDQEVEQLIKLSSEVSLFLYGVPLIVTPEEYRAAAVPTNYSKTQRWVAEYQGKVVGQARLDLPLTDKLDTCEVTYSVLPSHRDQGVEEALVTVLKEEGIVPSGRARINHFAVLFPEQDLDDPELTINKVAAILAISPKNKAMTRLATLPISEEAQEEVKAKLPKSPSYSLEIWHNEIPDEYLESVAQNYYQLGLDEPVGEAHQEPSAWTARRVQESVERTLATGEHILLTAALDAGKVVGISVLTYSPEKNNLLAWQNSTVVMPNYRRQGLARLLKYTSHQALPKYAPHVTRICTMNSELTPSMIRINKELGYREIWQEICYQN